MIKTKTIQTEKGRLLIVGGLPEDATDISIDNHTCIDKTKIWFGSETQDPLKCGGDCEILDEVSGNWKLLGPLADVTEEQAQKIVRKVTLGYWLDYKNPKIRHDYMKQTPKESLISLIESEVSIENMLGSGPSILTHSYLDLEEIQALQDEWQFEQEKVFTNPVLFWEPKK